MWKYLLHMCVKYNYLQYITNKYFTKLHKWPIKWEKVSTLLAFKEMESKQHEVGIHQDFSPHVMCPALRTYFSQQCHLSWASHLCTHCSPCLHHLSLLGSPSLSLSCPAFPNWEQQALFLESSANCSTPLNGPDVSDKMLPWHSLQMLDYKCLLYYIAIASSLASLPC